MFCGFICWILKNNYPRSGALARFSAPGVGVSHFVCARGGGGDSHFQKNSSGEGWSGLELTDT